MIMLAKNKPEPATLEESKRMKSLENIIAIHEEGFMQVASAIMEIRESGLFEKFGYRTFEDYCRRKWNWTKRYAYYLIGSAEVYKALPESTVNYSSLKETHMRELAKAKPDERVEVLEVVSSAGPVTAKAIRKEIAKRNPPPPAPIKLARVITPEPPEETFCADRAQAKLERAQELIKQIRALADDLEADVEIPAPDAEVDFDVYGHRLLELARLVRKLNPVSK